MDLWDQTPQTSQDLFHQLDLLSELKFSGRVDVRSSRSAASLYFCLGRLVWFAGGYDPLQRWHRLLNQFCPSLKDIPIDQLASVTRGTQGYEFLSELLRQGQISREQLVALIETALGEILFDLWQDHMTLPPADPDDQAGALQADRDEVISSPMTMVRLEPLIKQVKANWQRWQHEKLGAYSPNLAPRICQEERLRQQTSSQTFEILSSLINGQRSLRSLAHKMNQDLLTLTRALLPYITHGVVELVEPAPRDLRVQSTPSRLSPDVPDQAPESSRPLIVCIDDSPLVSKTLEGILTPARYQFAAITDPLQAVPLLLKMNPDLIFLDLVMPVVNGYEICAQLRRISAFKHTPIIILTGNDGIIDRMRTKWVGSTEFLAKPIDAVAVLATVDHYLAQSDIPSS